MEDDIFKMQSYDECHYDVMYRWSSMKVVTLNKYEHRHEKTCLGGFRAGKTQTLYIETRGIILSRQRTTKALIRMHGCAG